MADYILREEAEADIRRIYAYGFYTFGETLADQYFDGLFRQFELIAEQPLAYPAVDHIRSGYRRSVFGKESIYYTITERQVTIVAIIRQQDVDTRLT